jgi:cell pole-organizing protein PopZ
VECGFFGDRKADDVESEMNQPAKAQEPSMEEILASIRRIISDDDAKPAAAPAEAAPAPAAPKPAAAKPTTTPPPPAPSPVAAPAPAPAPAAKNSQDDIDAMLASFDAPAPAAPPAAPEVEEAEDVFELTEQMAVPAAAADGFQKVEPHDDLEFTESSPSPAAKAEEAPVLSGTTAKAVESAFNSLATTVLTNNARTLEDLVKEMLRPMLKSWLDDNLPTLVERIVKAEIERVARGR